MLRLIHIYQHRPSPSHTNKSTNHSLSFVSFNLQKNRVKATPKSLRVRNLWKKLQPNQRQSECCWTLSEILGEFEINKRRKTEWGETEWGNRGYSYEEWSELEKKESTWESRESFCWREFWIASMKSPRHLLLLIGWAILHTESKPHHALLNGESKTWLLALTENPILSRSESGTGIFLSVCVFICPFLNKRKWSCFI